MLRSLLFIPADSVRKIQKTQKLFPQALIFDLEDAVSIESKNVARDRLSQTLQTFCHPSARLFVRINSLRTEFFQGDLEAAVVENVDGLVLPKSQEVGDLLSIAEMVSSQEEQRGIPEGKIQFLVLIESVLGVLQALELARTSERTRALVFGAEDYCADMGIRRSKGGQELAYARSVIAHAAHASGLEAIDTVFSDLEDESGLFDETRLIRQMGFTGKLLIHPKQIETVHRAFSPDLTEVAWAERVVEAFVSASAEASGVALVDGEMVDEPVFRQARTILGEKITEDLKDEQ